MYTLMLILHVAPPAGAWIETFAPLHASPHASSLPPRERGLKHLLISLVKASELVAPPAGAWIETQAALGMIGKAMGRSPCGSVD